MLQSVTQLLFQRTMIMAFFTRNVVSLSYNIQNLSRPFDEILYSSDLSTSSNNDNHCPNSTSTKDLLT